MLEATSRGVILYNRANGFYAAETVESLAESYPDLIGFKDGVGDFEQLATDQCRLRGSSFLRR